MRLLFIILVLTPFVSFDQNFKVGESISISGAIETIPLTVTDEYAITFFPSKPMSLPYLNSATSVDKIDFSYKDKFSLVKFNLSDLSKKTKSFSIASKNIFSTYCATQEKLFVISSKKKKEDNSISYYLDVVDFDLFKVEVKNKELIKFTDGYKRKIFFFHQNKNGFEVIFKPYKLIDNNLVYDYFTFNKDFEVTSYLKIPIKSENSKWIYSTYVSDEKLNLFLENLITYKSDSVFYSTFGILKMEKDTFNFNEYSMPDNRYIEGFNVIDKNKNLKVVTLLSDKNHRVKEFYIFGRDTLNNSTISLPETYIESIKNRFKLNYGDVLNYRFKLISDNILSIESFIKTYDVNTGATSYNYGPAVILCIHSDKIKWFNIIPSDSKVKLKSNLYFLKLNSELYVLYKRRKQHICEKINLNNGFFEKINIGELENKKLIHTHIYNYKNDKDINFFYLSRSSEINNPLGSFKIYPIYFSEPK